MVNLTLTEKGGSTNELSFDKPEVTIGRVRGNDVVLPKGNVSKHHCRLLIGDGEIVVEDLHSTNGTYVNGRKIGEPTALATGDKIFVGDFIMRIGATDALINHVNAYCREKTFRRWHKITTAAAFCNYAHLQPPFEF